MTMKPFEIISIDSDHVSCDGGGGALGHPKVYLHIKDGEGSVTCPYCSRMYVRKEAPKQIAAAS